MYLNKSSSVVPTSQCYVIKQMVNAIACTIELWMHLGGLLSTQEARVALGSYARGLALDSIHQNHPGRERETEVEFKHTS